MKLLSTRGSGIIHHVCEPRHLWVAIAPCKVAKVGSDIRPDYPHHVEDLNWSAENRCAGKEQDSLSCLQDWDQVLAAFRVPVLQIVHFIGYNALKLFSFQLLAL